MHGFDERLTISKAISGDAEAFAELYRQNVGKIRGVVSWKLRDPDEIDDLVQCTFMRAFKGLKSFGGRSAFSTWLTRIAINECLSLLRKRATQANYWECESVVVDILDKSGPSSGPDPETHLFAKERQTQVREGIWALEGVYREVVWLRYIEHMSVQELADYFGVVEGTIKTWLYRARRKLASVLTKDLVN